MKTTLKYAVAAVALMAGVNAATAAGEHIPAVTDYANANIKSWISDKAVVEAIKAQNAENASLAQGDIDALDQKWRAGVDGGATAMIAEVLGNSLSGFLRDKQMASNGVITEIFVTDDKGLNVGQSDVTSDYWQGDEAKWQKTYGSGGEAVFVDGVEQDESTQMLQSQASFTIVDPETGQPIGAATVGINLDKL